MLTDTFKIKSISVALVAYLGGGLKSSWDCLVYDHCVLQVWKRRLLLLRLLSGCAFADGRQGLCFYLIAV
jgi:hypothetical protein